MGLSGFAGLGYQVVWTQQATLWLGHESIAVLAVVAAFFAGLGAGAFAFGSFIERSDRPERWYALCELTIAAWSLVLALLLAPVSHVLLVMTGEQPSAQWQWFVAFGGTFAVLLPATAAMGATLPAMQRMMMRCKHDAQVVSGLYAGNTFGATLGVLVSAFWWIPAWGLTATAALCALLNLLCAWAALRLFGMSVAGVNVQRPLAQSRGGDPFVQGVRGILPLLALTGLLGIGYEVLAVRVLSQVSEDTVYTFALLLAVYLVGSAAGAAAYRHWAVARVAQSAAGAAQDDARRVLVLLLSVQACTCLVGALGLWASDGLRKALLPVGAGMAAALSVEGVLALAAFALPTVVMGALFSHLAVLALRRGHALGQALGVNTIGAAMAPWLFGVLLIPALGAKAAVLCVVVGYVLLAACLARSSIVRSSAWWAAALGASGLALWAPSLSLVDVPPGGRVLAYLEGSMAAVSVVEDDEGVLRLRINNRQQEGSSDSVFSDARQALLPLLLHPAPQRVLFLGLGTGVTAASAAADTSLQVDAVELLPEVIEASALFNGVVPGTLGNPRLHLKAADARRYVKTTAQRYQLIVSDNFHPARSGSGALYTVEHFNAIKLRLTPDGLFCQWLPLHQLDLDTLRSIVNSFLAVYPQAWALLSTNSLDTPVLGLVARAGARRFEFADVRHRLSSNTMPQPLPRFGLADEFALLGSFVAGPAALARFAADAPLNTDDHPVVAYAAPRITYAPDSLPRERLVALLRTLKIQPAELVDVASDETAAQRLADYWAARDRFIAVGQRVQPTADVHLMLSQVREPLLSVLRISADFRPAYDPLWRMSVVLSRTDPAAARALWQELQKVQPARAEAARALASDDIRP